MFRDSKPNGVCNDGKLAKRTKSAIYAFYGDVRMFGTTVKYWKDK